MRQGAAQFTHRIQQVSHFRVKGPPARDNYQRNRLNQLEQSRSALSDTPLGTRPGDFSIIYSLYIQSISITVIFLYLAFLYLAEAVIIMPSPRNHIWDVFSLAAAHSEKNQSAESE